MSRLKRTLASGLLVTCLPLLSCAGCAVANQKNDHSPGFDWVLVGTNDRGCEMFTKRSASPGVVVDSAIWYHDASGNFVLDANSCVPVSKGVFKNEK